MTISYSDYINIVKSRNAKKSVKIEILNNNEEVIDSIESDLISGDIQKSSDSGSRRNCNITLNNIDASYIPESTGIWIHTKMKIYTGYFYNSEYYYVNQGIFCLSEPEVVSSLEETTANLVLYDKWAVIMDNQLEANFVIDVGTSIEDAVIAVCTAAGEVKPPVVEPTTDVTPYTYTAEAGSTYGEILIELANMLSWVAFYDNEGYLRFEPPTNIETGDIEWDFTTGEINYLGGIRRYEFSKVKNNIIIIGDSIDGSLVRYNASDTDVSSDTRISLIGTRTLVIKDDNISTLAQAEDRANYELQKAISVAETVSMNSILVDHLEGDNIITITDIGLGCTGERYLIKNLSIPLGIDSDQTLQVWKCRTVV